MVEASTTSYTTTLLGQESLLYKSEGQRLTKVAAQDQKGGCLTLVNSANWDSEAPGSILGRTIAFCANASVHVLELTDDGFEHRYTVGFSAKFKKQFCRCTTVLLLSKTAMLVSLDKRTVVWHQDITNATGKTTSVSVGDVVIKMIAMPAAGGKTSSLTKVVALTSHGIVYRLTLSDQKGISLELVSKERVQSAITASELIVTEQGSIEVLYGTEDGQVGQIEMDPCGVVTQRSLGEFQNKAKVSSVLKTSSSGALASAKDGTLMFSKSVGDATQLTFVKMPATSDDVEETKSQKRAAPKTLQSYRLLRLAAATKVLISGKDGHLYIYDSTQMEVELLLSQASFDQSLKLVSDNGHNMPVLQLLGVDDDDCETFVSFGYDRTVVAWQLVGDFIDQISRVPCLGQVIDKGMVVFASPDEALIVQNRPSCQKLLCLELNESQTILTSDLTSTKILDRSATITAFTAATQDDSSLVALVYDCSRIVIYDTLQKELVKKYKPSQQGQILAIFMGHSNSLSMLLASSPSRIGQLELQSLCLTSGKVTKQWTVKANVGAVSESKILDTIVSYQEQKGQWTSVFIEESMTTKIVQNCEVLALLNEDTCLRYRHQGSRTLEIYSRIAMAITKEAKLAFDLNPFLTAALHKERDQLAVVQYDLTNQIVLIDLATLSVSKRVNIAEVLGGHVPSIFSGKATCLAASENRIVIASEDKCLRVVNCDRLDQAQPLALTPSAAAQCKKQKQQDGSASEKRQKVDSTQTGGAAGKNDNGKAIQAVVSYEKTLFSIVRSRVFYQQKSADTQVAIKQLLAQASCNAAMLSTEVAAVDDCLLDLKILLFHSEQPAKNLNEAVAVIKAELLTCVFIQKFEYFQKLIVLTLWLTTLKQARALQQGALEEGAQEEGAFEEGALEEGLEDAPTVSKVQELIQMHLPNIAKDPAITEEYRRALEETCRVAETPQPEVPPTCDFLHLRATQKMFTGTADGDVIVSRSTIIDDYLERGCFVEALVLSKLWHDKAGFAKALSTLLGQLKRERKQQQVSKVEQALQILKKSDNDKGQPAQEKSASHN